MSREAVVVRQLDRLDMVFQALEYERLGSNYLVRIFKQLKSSRF
ncbi:MAG: hypothetical protein HY518_01980 [Candidatus Aenigmarchaeota archaeon]|nr:hypothetical protein [Candidatus Aenigmarchaeota archaeon]